MYANFGCNYRSLKTEPHRMRLVADGDKLDDDDNTGAPAASLI